ncbi:MAG: adenylate/guanylate cyclase domain-containing protein [Pseudomonadota bacterium]
MNEKLNRTSICSIVFLDIIDYSKKSVSEQIDIKNQFNELINHSLKDVDQNERIILDTGDGAAIAHLGSPEDALFVSLNIRDEIIKSNILSSMPLYVRFGINLGPVRLVSDINGQPNIIGDGINVAQRIMSFAKPNQIVVSRSYYDVTSRLTQEISQMFDYSGIKHDKHVREHEIYSVRLMKDLATPETKTAQSAIYKELTNNWFNRISWKYVALSLPALFTCAIVIKSAASPSEPLETTASLEVAEKILTKPIDATVERMPENGSIQLANYAVNNKIEAETEIVSANKIAIEEPLKDTPENKQVQKKVAKKSDSKKLQTKKVEKKQSTELPPEFIVPENEKTQPKTIAKVTEPQVNAELSAEKSGWKTFTDSVKQGQQRNCTQVELTMNQCH